MHAAERIEPLRGRKTHAKDRRKSLKLVAEGLHELREELTDRSDLDFDDLYAPEDDWGAWSEHGAAVALTAERDAGLYRPRAHARDILSRESDLEVLVAMEQSPSSRNGLLYFDPDDFDDFFPR